jgi:hypothetical protein
MLFVMATNNEGTKMEQTTKQKDNKVRWSFVEDILPFIIVPTFIILYLIWGYVQYG